MKLRIGITIGDPNGIGSEILIKIFSDPHIVDLFTPIIYGNRAAMDYYQKRLRGNVYVNLFYIDNASKANPKRVNFISVGPSNFVPQPGTSTKDAGEISVAALMAVADDAQKGQIDAIVTGPIDKNNTFCESFPYIGHTGFFADRFHGKTDPLMFMVSENVKVGLVTMHTPLSEVASKITESSIVDHIRMIRDSLVMDFACTHPRIAVLSLNPHSGDGGVIGTEEKDVIMPAISEAENMGLVVAGPFAADGFFGSGAYGKFDAVLAMYHDQGLAPFKSLAISGGVNFTAGLSVVRTSPAHGVGYDIAGTGVADPSSMRAAIFMAIDIVRNRDIHKEISSNPLRYVKKRGGDKIQKEKNVDEMILETED